MAGTIPPVSPAEDCKTIVQEQIREYLRLELAIEDISMGHRIGVELAMQGRERKIGTLSFRRPQPHTTIL